MIVTFEVISEILWGMDRHCEYLKIHVFISGYEMIRGYSGLSLRRTEVAAET
jgi:hypothetical protein